MIIKRKRIRNLDRYAKFIPRGKVIAGVANPPVEKLKLIGFPESAKNGQTILPSPVGTVSSFNADGREEIRKDQPMETAYRNAEWRWTEWHGHDRVEKSKIVDIPYQRYPRNFIPPPGVELVLTTDTNGRRIIICPAVDRSDSQKELLTHSVNLLLEIFGECDFFDAELNQFIKAPLQRLNWRILPPGKRPWESLKNEVKSVLAATTPGKKIVMEYRLETINSYQPEFAAIGEGGFTGYIVLGFPAKNLYVLESLFYGNATYLFGERWEELSKKTKAEILNQKLQAGRIIHRENWMNHINNLLAVKHR